MKVKFGLQIKIIEPFSILISRESAKSMESHVMYELFNLMQKDMYGTTKRSNGNNKNGARTN